MLSPRRIKSFRRLNIRGWQYKRLLYRLTGGYGISYRIMELFDFEIDLNDNLD